MSHAELKDVQQVGTVENTYTPAQLFGKLKTLEGLSDAVFYVPFVCDLVRNQTFTKRPTDIFSHTLTQVMDNHPLVITDLPQRVFELQPPILRTNDRKIAERTIYAVPKEAWHTLSEHLTQVTAVDRPSRRFCVFRMYEEEIACPLGVHADQKIKVWFCNLYGNKETYYFTKGTNEKGECIMQLHHSPPIREFVELGEKLLGKFQETPEDRAYADFVDETEKQQRLLALKENVKLQEAITAKPLEESQLNAKQRADCYEMIRLYHQLYPPEA